MRAQSDRNPRPHAKRVDTNVDGVPDRGSTPLASTTVFSKPLRLKGFSVGRCPEDVGEVPTFRSCLCLHLAVVGTASFAVQFGIAPLNQLGEFTLQGVTVGSEGIGGPGNREGIPGCKQLKHLSCEWREVIGNAGGGVRRQRPREPTTQAADLRFQ